MLACCHMLQEHPFGRDFSTSRCVGLLFGLGVMCRRHVMAQMAWQASAAGTPVTRPTCPSMLCMLCLFSALQGLLRKLGAGFEDILPGMLGMGSGKMKVRGKRSGRRGGCSRIVSFGLSCCVALGLEYVPLCIKSRGLWLACTPASCISVSFSTAGSMHCCLRVAVPVSGGLCPPIHSRHTNDLPYCLAQAIITGLRAFEDESQQLSSLTELCEYLSIASEDALASFPVETVVPLLVRGQVLGGNGHEISIMQATCSVMVSQTRGHQQSGFTLMHLRFLQHMFSTFL